VGGRALTPRPESAGGPLDFSAVAAPGAVTAVVEPASGEAIFPPEGEPRFGPGLCGAPGSLGREGGFTAGSGLGGEGVAPGAGGMETGGVFTGGCEVLTGGDGKGGTAGLVTAGGIAVLTTPSTAAFGSSTTSPNGLAEALIGARIAVSAAQIPTAVAAFLPLPAAQLDVPLSLCDPTPTGRLREESKYYFSFCRDSGRLLPRFWTDIHDSHRTSYSVEYEQPSTGCNGA
jgi:hypothetical protein